MNGHSYIVGVREEEADDGEVSWHIVGLGGGDYATACGLDGADSVADQFGTVKAGAKQKITCGQCWAIWRDLMDMRLREVNFTDEAKRS